MKKKLNEEAGLTLVEMLAATLIMVLLTMILGTGLQMTVNSYRKITAQAEVDLLLSTAIDALADELRFVWDVEGVDGDKNGFTYKSDSFEGVVKLTLDSDDKGQIIAERIYPPGTEDEDKAPPKLFLSTGAYGSVDSDGSRAYVVTKMEITPHKDDGTFTIDLEVATADESIKAGETVTVRYLNGLDGLKTPESEPESE